jgi:hypothetical protein
MREHAGLRGFAPEAAGRNAIGDRCDQAAAFVVGAGQAAGDEVFVVFTRAAFAAVADLDFEFHRSLRSSGSV